MGTGTGTARRISGTEVVAAIGGVALAIGLFLPWYELQRRAELNGVRGPEEFTGWQAHDLQRYLLIAAAAAPFILTYVILRGHKLSWARGELTAVVSIAAFGLVLYAGLIDRPGEPQGLVGLRFGWFVAMAGTILMLVGSSLRASTSERPRKPPGVL